MVRLGWKGVGVTAGCAGDSIRAQLLCRSDRAAGKGGRPGRQSCADKAMALDDEMVCESNKRGLVDG